MQEESEEYYKTLNWVELNCDLSHQEMGNCVSNINIVSLQEEINSQSFHIKYKDFLKRHLALWNMSQRDFCKKALGLTERWFNTKNNNISLRDKRAIAQFVYENNLPIIGIRSNYKNENL